MTRCEYVFRAELADHRGVIRVVALREEQTLDDLHELFRAEFGWNDPHLYSFWLSGQISDGPETEYTAPYALEDSEAQSAATPIAGLGLKEGQQIGYVFDFGAEWEVEVTVSGIRDAAAEEYPRVLEREGEAPPQYEYEDDHD